jgi:hypothetical protein
MKVNSKTTHLLVTAGSAHVVKGDGKDDDKVDDLQAGAEVIGQVGEGGGGALEWKKRKGDERFSERDMKWCGRRDVHYRSSVAQRKGSGHERRY